MKVIIQNVQYIILISLFGFFVATPAQAAVSPLRAAIRADVRENTSTRPGALRPIILTRAAIGMGTVTVINGTTITVLGKDGKTYTVLTDSTTQFRRLYWGKGTLSEIQVNDQVSVIGKWIDDPHTTIQAKLFRDISIQKFAGVFFGTVQSVTSTGWVMTTVNRGNQTVTVSSTTKFTDRKGGSLTQSTIVVGNKVRVRGLWDRKNSTVTEVAVVKDFSLPVASTITGTPSATPTP